MAEPTAIEARAPRRPRPFSLAFGIVFLVIGVAAVISAWATVDAGGVAAVALLLGGVAALAALSRRRAPS